MNGNCNTYFCSEKNNTRRPNFFARKTFLAHFSNGFRWGFKIISLTSFTMWVLPRFESLLNFSRDQIVRIFVWNFPSRPFLCDYSNCFVHGLCSLPIYATCMFVFFSSPLVQASYHYNNVMTCRGFFVKKKNTKKCRC